MNIKNFTPEKQVKDSITPSQTTGVCECTFAIAFIEEEFDVYDDDEFSTTTPSGEEIELLKPYDTSSTHESVYYDLGENLLEAIKKAKSLGYSESDIRPYCTDND